MAEQNDKTQSVEQPGCLMGLIGWAVRGMLRLLGFGGKTMRATVIPPDTKYQGYVDTWVSERIALWLHETRSDIDAKAAAILLNGQTAENPPLMSSIRQTLIDAKVTFSQRDGTQFIEVEAYMAPRQTNGKSPQILRWRAEREIGWQEIPDAVREKLIRFRQPVTLEYSLPEG